MGAHSTAMTALRDVAGRPDARTGVAGAPLSRAVDQVRPIASMAHALHSGTDDEICHHCRFAAGVHASHCPEFKAAMAWGGDGAVW